MLKSINISEELHKELRIYVAKYGTTINKVAESSIRNTISQKPSEIKVRVRPLK